MRASEIVAHLNTAPPRRRKPYPRDPAVAKRNARIRKMYATGRWTQDALAAKFGLTQGTITLIINKKRSYSDES